MYGVSLVRVFLGLSSHTHACFALPLQAAAGCYLSPQLY